MLDKRSTRYILDRQPDREEELASRIAHRRAAKAAHRKRLLKERRGAAPTSLAERVRHLAHGKLHCCLMQQALPDTGISSVVLARDTDNGQVAMAAFLVDAFALGIKDVLFDVVEPSEFAAHIAFLNIGAPLTPVEPSYARKLLRAAAGYAASLGLRPYRGFAAIEGLFGDVRAEDCSETFEFGCEGKPLYLVGPGESTEQVIRRFGRLYEQLGPDGFDFAIPPDDWEEGEDGADAPAARRATA